MREFTRRSLLVASATAGLLAVAAPAEAATARAAVTRRPTGTGLRDGFRPAVGRLVSATGDGRRYQLRLSEIADLPTGDPQRCFNLLFTHAGGTTFVEGIYRLSGPGLRPTSLLLLPVDRPDHANQRVQAVINRLG